MPFDELRQRALEALEPRTQAYRSAVAAAVDEVRTLLESQRAPSNGKHERVASELGLFAAGRIDPERFGSLFAEREALDADAVERVGTALDTLEALLAEGDAVHTLRLPAAGDLRDAVRAALARAGKAFGAGRAVEHARTGTRATEYDDGFPPERWNRAERAIAPPLVVELEGADLRPAGLIDFVDGRQVIVLLVRQPAPPAALARLVGPGTLVVQGAGADALDPLRGWDGPAVIALLPEGAAAFTWRPAGDAPGALTIDAMPEAPTRAVGGLSAARQRSDLELLRMMDAAAAGRVVAAAGAVAGAGAGASPTEPADVLAAWLLRQATIPEPGQEA